MRVLLGLTTAVCSMFLASCANTPVMKINTDINSSENEKLVQDIPVGWIEAESSTENKNLSTIYLPRGQKLTNWREKMVTSVFKDQQHKTAKEYAVRSKQLHPVYCPGGTSSKLESGIENGYSFVSWNQFCPNNPISKQNEFTVFKAIKGNDRFYVLQKAWVNTPSEYDKQRWAEYFNNTFVCDQRVANSNCLTANN